MKNYLDDIVALLGVVAIFYGSWLIFPPAAFIVCGLLLVGASLLRARAAVRRGEAK